ncbi:MAG: hypothetical protein A2Y12_19430 [Planctomycetes bacterium GWF2_42_9]|nr:MAG: hypothetical protein A2Y12_19430 [Planctomycetes bacterium GWF2_42_9]
MSQFLDRWDPLESASNSAAEFIAAAKKKEIYNILKSYVGFYDPFCELLQNAMDAVDARKRELAEPTYRKQIFIKINIDENYISVTDNGIGFNEDKFTTFLCPNVSFKDSSSGTRGKKGVGATYLAYGFNFLQLGTKTPDFQTVREIKDGRKWVDDREGVITRPFVTISTLIHSSFVDIDRGSTFTIKFGGNTRPKDLLWVAANNAEQWQTILLTKTPLGDICVDGVNSDIFFEIEVVDRAGNSTRVSNQNAKYNFPHLVIGKSLDLKDISAAQQRMIDSGRDPSVIPARFKNLNALYSYWSVDDLLSAFRGRDETFLSLIRDFSITAYGFFCYSTKIWDAYNDNVVKLRKGTRILRGGLQLATNRMPQGDLITIPLTSNIGYQNQTHVIVHFSNADPDLGRKGFQPELRDVAEEISVHLVNVFKRRRQHLRSDSDDVPAIFNQGALHEWIRQQEDYERDEPLSITNRNFFLPTREIAITSKPVSEQDVIVLFNQLIAGGVIRGIKLMATSSHQQYDGIFRYFVGEPLEHHIFDCANNPLGFEQSKHRGGYLSKPYVLEYKYNVDALIDEIASGEKNESDIDLVIAWSLGCNWKRRYQVISLLDLDNLQHRNFHGITHMIHSDNGGQERFAVIILSELIDYLNDPLSNQAKQKALYGDLI